MTDGELRAEEVDALDAAWDDLNDGRSGRAAALDASDVATLMALDALVDVSPRVGRRIWSDASAEPARSDYQERRRTETVGSWPVHLVAPAASGWGWLPAGMIAMVAAIAILGGILFGRNDGEGITQTFPSDASSVVATLPSAAPAWATPGGEEAD